MMSSAKEERLAKHQGTPFKTLQDFGEHKMLNCLNLIMKPIAAYAHLVCTTPYFTCLNSQTILALLTTNDCLKCRKRLDSMWDSQESNAYTTE
jgi:hypothetical protein